MHEITLDLEGLKYYKSTLTTRMAIQWLTSSCWTHKMQSSTLNLQVARVKKTYLNFEGGITLNTKQLMFIAKQISLLIVRCDSPIQQLTQKLWLPPIAN
jgi:hypothetical protein